MAITRTKSFYHFQESDMRGPGFPGHGPYATAVAVDDQVYAATVKKDAIEFAKRHGWQVKDVRRGRSRFFAFYFVGREVNDAFDVIQRDGAVRRIEMEVTE